MHADGPAVGVIRIAIVEAEPAVAERDDGLV
jgi:hypothetical protein